MELQVKDAGDGVLNVSLAGRLDTPGVDSIETLLTAHLVPRGALGRKSGKLVLYGAPPLVAQVLLTTSLHDIVPVRMDAAAAAAVARG